MSKKALWCLVAFLTCVCMGEGYYLYAQKSARTSSPSQDIWPDQDKWISEARKDMFQGMPIPFKRFDELFNDDFFGRKFDPFTEIENMQKRFNPFFNDQENSIFKRSWGDWFQNRMDLAGIRPETKVTGDEVILSLKVPGLQKGSMNINVNQDRIRLTCDAKDVQDRTDGQGKSHFRSESVQHFEKIIPVPAEADSAQSRIVQEGDEVKIIFKKRPRQETKT